VGGLAGRALPPPNAALRKAVTVSPPDVDRFLEYNREFHALVLEAAGSRKLVSLLASVIEQPVVWRTAHHYGEEELRRSCSEHEELLAAFARRDGGWAETIMAGHIRRAFHAYADAHRGLTAIDKPGGRRRA
jgi:DNA-binding GntR family transcriptional regulator